MLVLRAIRAGGNKFIGSSSGKLELISFLEINNDKIEPIKNWFELNQY